MGVIARDTGGGDFTPVPEGTHLAICNMVVDLGLQETTFKGEVKIKPQVYVRWELPHERMNWTDKDGQEHEGPMVIGKVYTLSLSEKANLRKDLEGWRGKRFTEDELKGFDLLNLLGKGCQVTVTHREKEDRTYANVNGVAGWPKGTPKPETTEVSILKYASDDTGDFDDLPEWLRKKIESQKSEDDVVDPGPPSNGHDDLDDEIPF